ncbi:hypothetical protein BGZ82_008616 [Podila clonocystis]|nr:hypothetical protein BGZ82_008616 [Podila clonocystis]
MASNGNIILFCIVDGEPHSRAFSVEIDPTKTVDHLKKLIKAEKTNDFSDIDADKLTLWKVSISDDGDDDERLILFDRVSEKKKLKTTTKLSKVFDAELPNDTIHILVRHPEPTRQSEDLDAIKIFTITIKGITPKTVEWITTPKTATLDHLREVIYDKHPTLRDRSQTIVYEHYGAAGYLLTDSALQTHVRMSVRDGVKHLVLRLEDPPKLFSEITCDDPFRLFGVRTDLPQPFDEARTISFTQDKHTQALDNLYVTLEAAIASMPPGDKGLFGPRSRCYTNAFLMHAVALFPELKLIPGKEIAGRRAYGALDYAVELKADSSRMLAVTTFDPSDDGTGVARNVVQIDTIMSNRKRKRSDDDDDSNDGSHDSTPIVSFGIATDSREWYLQQCKIDKLQETGQGPSGFVPNFDMPEQL